MVPHGAGDADPAGLGQCFQACGDVDAVAVDVASLGDDIAEIYPDAEVDPLIFGDIGIAVDHCALDLDSATDRVNDARELDEHSVASRLYDTAVVFVDFGIDELAAVRLKALVRPLLIRPHKPRITCHIGSEYRGEVSRRAAFDPSRADELRSTRARSNNARGTSRAPCPPFVKGNPDMRLRKFNPAASSRRENFHQ